MYGRNAATEALRQAGVPVYRSVERAVATLARLARAGESAPDGVPAVPPPAPPITDGGYAAARALLADAGVPFAPAETVTADADEAAAAARRVGYPVVLKALGLLHKSDAGGVVLGLRDEAALRAAVADVRARLDPPALSVEHMAPLADGIELLIGARRDARFGPVALAGLGGVYAEMLDDVAVALAPVGEDQAERMLLSLRARGPPARGPRPAAGRRPRRGRGARGAVARRRRASRDRRDRGQPAARAPRRRARPRRADRPRRAPGDAAP